MKSITKVALLGVSLGALVSPMQAFAQTETSAAEEADESEVIIVQARRKDESLQEVPLSLQAVSGAQLQRLEIRNFQDISATVPGLQLTRAPNGIQNTVTMRGVTFNPTAAGSQTAVELYRNDVVTSSAAIFQSLYDIGQIEVLRGPQGTLRGRATPSGSITITTRKPDLSELGGYATGTYAEGDKQIGEGAINVPIFTDRLGIRIAGYTSKDRLPTKGYNRFTDTKDRRTHDDVSSFRASIRAVPFEDVLTLDFNYEETDRDVRSYNQVQSRNGVDGTAITGPVDISPRENFGIQVLPNLLDGKYKFYNWQAQLKLVGQQLTYVGGRLDALSASLSPEDFGGFLSVPVAPALDVATPPGVSHPFAQETFSEQHQRVHEVRLQSDERIAGIFDYVVGYLNLKSKTPTLLYTTQTRCTGGVANCLVTPPAGGLASMVLGGTLRTAQADEESFFGNLTVHIGESTELSGGVRRITFDRLSGLQSAGRNAAQALLFDREPIELLRTRTPVASFTIDDTTKKTIYQFSGKHKFSDDLMVYANYGTSFRLGNGIVCARCNAAQGTGLNAGGFLQQPNETSNSIEAGFKSSLLDDRVTFNVSAFRQKFKNFVIASPAQIQFLGTFSAGPPATGALSGFVNTFGQANDVKITGVEADFGFRPSREFNIGGNITYAKSKVSNGRVPCVDLNNDGFQDANPVTAATLPLLVAQAGAGLVDICPVRRATPAPNFSAVLQSEYNSPVGSLGEGYVRGLLTYNGRTPGDDVNPVDSIKSYALLNLYFGIRDEDGAWDVSGFIRNVTQTRRVVSREGTRAQSTIANTSFVSDYYNISTLAPREVGISLRVAFGSR